MRRGDGEIEILAETILVEDAPRFQVAPGIGAPHQGFQVLGFTAAEGGVLGLFDIPQIGIAAILGVDEGVHVAELEFDRRPDVVVAEDGGMVADDLEPALDLAPVVVGQFEDEEVLEQIAVALGDGGHGLLDGAQVKA